MAPPVNEGAAVVVGPASDAAVGGRGNDGAHPDGGNRGRGNA